MPKHAEFRLLVNYELHMIDDEETLAPIGEHLLTCSECRAIVLYTDRQHSAD